MASIAATALLAGSATAPAAYDYFCTGTGVNANSRCVSAVGRYLYGVGVNKWDPGMGNVTDNPCVGAKQNSDGSGGNVIPFSCFSITYNQARWTPGGSSGFGYGTIINYDSWWYASSGALNYRP